VNVFFLCYFRVSADPQITFRCIRHNTCVLICRIDILSFTDVVKIVNIRNSMLKLKCYYVLCIIDSKIAEMHFIFTCQV
jgi:hypothetical protein